MQMPTSPQSWTMHSYCFINGEAVACVKRNISNILQTCNSLYTFFSSFFCVLENISNILQTCNSLYTFFSSFFCVLENISNILQTIKSCSIFLAQDLLIKFRFRVRVRVCRRTFIIMCFHIENRLFISSKHNYIQYKH